MHLHGLVAALLWGACSVKASSYQPSTACLQSVVRTVLAASGASLQNGQTIATLSADIVTAIEAHMDISPPRSTKPSAAAAAAAAVPVAGVATQFTSQQLAPAVAAAAAAGPPECRRPKKSHLHQDAEGDLLKIEGLVPNIICIIILIICAAMAAGLTTGLLSIEPLEMAIKQR
jgi:hypothetical protein